MSRIRIAYMPLVTYPSAITDDAVRAAVAFAAPLGCALDVRTFSVALPPLSSGLGDYFLDVPGLVRAAEGKSLSECHRLEVLVRESAAPLSSLDCATTQVPWGAVFDRAAAEARLFDLCLLPWSAEIVAAQDMAQAVVFGSGRPAVLVPPVVHPSPLDHVAIAWDASAAAARSLGDVLPLLAEGGMITVLTIGDEKPLSGPGLASALVSSLAKRGFNAKALEVPLGMRTISEALQGTALSTGAKLLAMGGFGHSRIRDFVLGGATKGVLAQLRLPVLLSH